MTMLQRFAGNLATRTLALAAAGVVGFASLGDIAHARSDQGVKAPFLEQLADRSDRGRSNGRDVYDIRCEAAAIRRGGARLKGTYSSAVRDTERQACRVALKECQDKLARERRHDRRAYPFANCKVVDTDRVLAKRGRGRGDGPKIILRF